MAAPNQAAASPIFLLHPAVYADVDLMLLQLAGERPLRSPCVQDVRDFERHKLIAYGRHVPVVQSILPRQVLSFQFG
jgi:hypothetical protein